MLLELPTHLQTIIVSYITPVSDVQALFSTCTQLHALAQSPGVLAQWLVQQYGRDAPRMFTRCSLVRRSLRQQPAWLRRTAELMLQALPTRTDTLAEREDEGEEEEERSNMSQGSLASEEVALLESKNYLLDWAATEAGDLALAKLALAHGAVPCPVVARLTARLGEVGLLQEFAASTAGGLVEESWRDGALAEAAAAGQLEVMEWLLPRGADFASLEEQPLCRAAGNGQLEAVHLLLAWLGGWGDGLQTQACGLPALVAAAERGHGQVVLALMQAGVQDSSEGHALYQAVSGGHLAIVQLLVVHRLGLWNADEGAADPTLGLCDPCNADSVQGAGKLSSESGVGLQSEGREANCLCVSSLSQPGSCHDEGARDVRRQEAQHPMEFDFEALVEAGATEHEQRLLRQQLLHPDVVAHTVLEEAEQPAFESVSEVLREHLLQGRGSGLLRRVEEAREARVTDAEVEMATRQMESMVALDASLADSLQQQAHGSVAGAQRAAEQAAAGAAFARRHQNDSIAVRQAHATDVRCHAHQYHSAESDPDCDVEADPADEVSSAQRSGSDQTLNSPPADEMRARSDALEDLAIDVQEDAAQPQPQPQPHPQPCIGAQSPTSPPTHTSPNPPALRPNTQVPGSRLRGLLSSAVTDNPPACDAGAANPPAPPAPLSADEQAALSQYLQALSAGCTQACLAGHYHVVLGLLQLPCMQQAAAAPPLAGAQPHSGPPSLQPPAWVGPLAGPPLSPTSSPDSNLGHAGGREVGVDPGQALALEGTTVQELPANPVDQQFMMQAQAQAQGQAQAQAIPLTRRQQALLLLATARTGLMHQALGYAAHAGGEAVGPVVQQLLQAGCVPCPSAVALAARRGDEAMVRDMLAAWQGAEQQGGRQEGGACQGVRQGKQHQGRCGEVQAGKGAES